MDRLGIEPSQPKQLLYRQPRVLSGIPIQKTKCPARGRANPQLSSWRRHGSGRERPQVFDAHDVGNTGI
ncbi:hypothetical protein C7402_14244 [Paraburkholderia unamae]|uniref:Uncharacterized protein n=1 Tax=Paraburkholderia unamae TaxID=219649 RepID=A0ABX5K730_9BURK|nr:hypothetical protein C7402_14244 [Paraburkholderia unamae]